jgi:hypothetical protein
MNENDSVTPKSHPPPPSEEDVATRAYQRWLDRGCPSGDGYEDWIAAKLELESEWSLRVARRQPDFKLTSANSTPAPRAARGPLPSKGAGLLPRTWHRSAVRHA